MISSNLLTYALHGPGKQRKGREHLVIVVYTFISLMADIRSELKGCQLLDFGLTLACTCH